jgi:hypothetical protein
MRISEYTRELNWVQNNSIFLDSIVNLTKINKNLITVHESGKNVITWAWPTSTTII